MKPFTRNLARHLYFRLMIAGLALFLSATGALAYDQWGDNGSTPVGGGSSPPPGGGDPGANNNGDKNGEGKEAEPVDLFTGQFELTTTDFDIPGRMPLRIKRFYRSGSSYQGMFGRGWNIEYNERIFVLATNGNLLLRADNSTRDEFVNRGDNTFAPPAGRYDTLARNGDGSYTLREKHGTIRQYNNEGCLTEIRDRNGNQLLFTYQPGGKLPINAISDFSHYTNAIVVARDYRLTQMEAAYNGTRSGRFIAFAYNPDGRVTNAIDFTGRSWTYSYDSQGYATLASARTPSVPGFSGGLTNTYGYSYYGYNARRLNYITDPANQFYLGNYYDSSGRVIRQNWGNATWDFQYTSELTRTVIDGDANHINRTFDTNGNVRVRTQSNGFFMDDRFDNNVPVVATNGYQYLCAQIRGSVLYLSTISLNLNFEQGHQILILVNDGPSGTFPAPGSIGGTVAHNTATKPYLLGSQWFNSNGGGQSIDGLEVLEATLDLQQAFGYLPSTIYIAVVKVWFPSPMLPGGRAQIPLGNGDNNVDANEFYALPLATAEPAAVTNTIQWEYNTNNEQTKAIFPKGNVEERKYDARGNLLEVRRKTANTNDSPSDIIQSYTYETQFNLIKTATDPNGNVTTYIYDYENPAFGTANGNLMQIAYPAVGGVASTVSFTYNAFGQVETATDPNGTVTKYVYDNNTGYLLQRIAAFGTPLSATNSYTYSSRGQVLTATDPRGSRTTFEYDNLDRLTQVTAPASLNYVTKYTYNANSKVSKIERQTGDAGHPWQTTTYTYDVLDRLMTVTDDMGHVTACEYDGNGNRTKVTDANTNSTTYVYDERDLLMKVTDAMMNTVQYAYNLNGSLAQLLDARSNATAYAYDSYDRLTTTTYPDSSAETFVYDPAGNLVAKGLRAGTWITNSFDALNRLILKTYSDASTIQYQYDAANRLLATTDPLGAMTFAYDVRGRLINTTNEFGKRVAYEFDANGNRSRLIYPDDTFVTYGYDGLSRLTNILYGGTNLVAGFAYDSLSRRIQLDYGNGTRVAYAYDWANNLTNVTHTVTNTGTVIGGFGYSYDNVGNRLTMTTTAIPSAGTHAYRYDKIYQLTNADYPAAYPFPDMGLTYDAAGNRSKIVVTGTTNYIVNNLNQYTSVGPKAYSYSANGDLASDGTTLYNYDDENRLTFGAKPGVSATYTYDAVGRRIEKNVNGVLLRFAYAGDQIIAETDGSGTVLRKYIFGTGLDECLRMDSGANRYYFHDDALGNVQFLTDNSATSVESYLLDTFGRLSGTGSTLGNRFLFTGREYDQELNLYYFRARHYSPVIGRFLQPDPIGLWGGINLYAYCNDNPVNWSDPFGLLDVHYWAPNGGGGSKGGWYGHVSITLDDGTYISYWPNRPINPPFDSTPSRPPDYAKDKAGEGSRDPQDIHVDGLDEAAIKNWWNDSSHGDFSTFNNCSDIVSDALRKGGADIPDHFINQPEQVKKDLDQYLKEHPTNSKK